MPASTLKWTRDGDQWVATVDHYLTVRITEWTTMRAGSVFIVSLGLTTIGEANTLTEAKRIARTHPPVVQAIRARLRAA